MKRALEQLVWRRGGGHCEYCLIPQNRDRLPFEIDQIIARRHGGLTQADNLCLVCFACNHHKGPNVAGVDPWTGRVVLLFHPRRHTWSRHFRWDGAVLVGLTPRGRATIAALKINLDYRVNFRLELIQEGIFPPR